jgi:hypothetical protein
MDCRCCLICQKWSPAAPGKRFRNSAQKRSLFRDQSCSQHKVEMSGDTPDFSIEPEGGMISPSQFTYDGHQVEIVPPDTVHLIGNFWQIKIDGVLQHEFLFSSSRVCGGSSQKTDRPRTTLELTWHSNLSSDFPHASRRPYRSVVSVIVVAVLVVLGTMMMAIVMMRLFVMIVFSLCQRAKSSSNSERHNGDKDVFNFHIFSLIGGYLRLENQ